MSQWEMVKLGDVYDIGSSKRVFQSEWKEEGVPFYRAREIVKLAENGYVNNKLFIDEEMYNNYSVKYGVPNTDDIMVTGVGTIGICYIVKEHDKFYFKDGNILWLKKKAEVNSVYIAWLFKSNYVKEQIRRQSSGTTVGTFTITTAKSIEIPLPPIEIQQKIAKTLDVAAALLKLRKQQLAELVQLIQSVFYEMFGDPVRNEKGWETGVIRDVVADVKYGTSKPAVEGGKYTYLRMNNITYDGHLDLTSLKYIDIPDKEVEKYIVRRGDVLFNRTNSKELVGKTCVFNQDKEMIIAGYIIRLRVNERVLPEYLSAVLNSQYGKSTLFGMCKAIIGQANINAQELQKIKICIPPIELQQEYVKVVNQVAKLKLDIQKSLDEMNNLFNALMQKYFE